MFSRHIQKAALATSALRRTDGPPEIISALHGSASTANITIKDANLRNIKNYGNKDTMIQKKVSNKKQALIEAAFDHKDFAMEVVTGIPDEQLKNRRVRIYKPSRNPMQSGVQNMKNWRIEFNNQERWENQNMGWGSTGDPLSNVAGWLKFKTQEDAVAFCIRQGWNVTEINDPNQAKPKWRTYGDNFSWNKRTRIGFK